LDGGKSIVPQIKPSLRPELKHIEIIQDRVSGAWISIIKKIQKYNIMTTITTQNSVMIPLTRCLLLVL
jgi:hypothetical protein